MKIIISRASWEELNIMSGESIDRMVDKTVSEADTMKLRTADALEEAARKLRSADMSARGDDVKNVLHDAEERIHQFKDEVDMKFHEMEAEYHKKVEPVETIISDHPIPAVMVAMGIGFLFGMLICKSHD
jgi:ElaB/YqjD/DUF883 family membrane-anchored ribosome-binding protein